MKNNPGKKTPTTFLRLEYGGLRYWLNDEHVTEQNFQKIQTEEPNRLVKIRRFMLPAEVPIKDIKITAIGNSGYIPTYYPSSY